jgi:NADH dehydrogenase
LTGPDDPKAPIAVFGGTGFLGRRIVRRLRDRGWAVRAVSRHPDRRDTHGAEPVTADIRDPAAVAHALAGARGAVNAVALYVERGGAGYRAVHVEAAGRLAALAGAAGVARLVQISGIGADPEAADSYVAARGAGERAVRDAFPAATVLRPSALFAEDGGLATSLIGLVRRLPVFPLFGDGATRLQPLHADDAAEAVARVLEPERAPEPLYELGGPEAWRYADLVRRLAALSGARVRLLPVPFAVWSALARVAVHLPGAPLTPAQVALMRDDNLPAPDLPDLAELGIAPRGIESVVPEILRRLDHAAG